MLGQLTPAEIRLRCRSGEFRRPTAGCAPGFVQANLIVLPEPFARDFQLFCERNPKPCPLLEVTQTGDPSPRKLAAMVDLRTDLPLYRIYEHGALAAEVSDVTAYWRNDLVSFLIGCSFTFEAALVRAGLRVRHLDEARSDGQPKNVPMYGTRIACHPAGVFRGPLVVSMRPFRPEDARQAAAITERFPRMHGGPVHQGDPNTIGIADLAKPDWGDPVTVYADEIPVFWACGVTPQAAVIASGIPFAITHAPGHMFISDRRHEEFEDSKV